jgi:hypothetical protein
MLIKSSDILFESILLQRLVRVDDLNNGIRLGNPKDIDPGQKVPCTAYI